MKKSWKACGKSKNCSIWTISYFAKKFSIAVSCRGVRKRGKGFWFLVSKTENDINLFFYTAAEVPSSYRLQYMHGFVEELVVNDDPEYQWIDKIRTPRSSNEARQRLFSKMSGKMDFLLNPFPHSPNLQLFILKK